MGKVIKYNDWIKRYIPTGSTFDVPTKGNTWSLIKRKGDRFIVPGIVHNAIMYYDTVVPPKTEIVSIDMQ